MALSQIQIIQSLGEALTWFEKELNWGVSPAELRHLTGRIGELYAAMITRGQMAPDTNQRGYDVVSADNERISVKTITSSSHVNVKGSTLNQVDRIMILRLNVSPEDGISIESLLDQPTDTALDLFDEIGSNWRFMVGTNRRASKPLDGLEIVRSATAENFEIKEYENGSFIVLQDGEQVAPALPILKRLATGVGIPLVWKTGANKNTRQLGSDLFEHLGGAEKSRHRVWTALADLKPLDD